VLIKQKGNKMSNEDKSYSRIREFIAHVKQNEDGTWKEPQALKNHLEAVANLAGNFADEFANKEWGELAGYLHDLGKYHPDWQKYLFRNSGFPDPDAHIENYGSRPNHSTAGAVYIFEKFKSSKMVNALAYIIAGHHSGLPDWNPQLYIRLFDEKRSLIKDDLEKIKQIDEAKEFLETPVPTTIPANFIFDNNKEAIEQNHLWIRMLFSCLVDADFLDTEKYMEEKERGNYLSLVELKKRLDDYLFTKKSDSELNKKRNEILKQCIDKAKLEPGFFSLTVPTGGGKTLSSMAFALQHALIHNKKRVIVAIPYTSIIEQTSKVFKYGSDIDAEILKLKREGEFLFGEDQVVEHHSNLDPEEEDHRNRLAKENWDAPIIVTTNVQLFESLFANKTSACRKLHNIANSVIILDEAQMIPTDYLKPIISVLKGLVKYFGVTVLLMSATQPALKGKIGSDTSIIEGLENVTEIIDDPDTLALKFKRVQIQLPKNLTEQQSFEDIAEELKSYERILCIVNRKDDCRQIHKLMPEGTIHLSGYMCGEERSEVISNIKNKLKNNESVRVISTQIVEAGVDIDFPVVYRALTGLDSIAQAAGRCNRENKLKEGGRVIVFNPPKPSPIGFLRKAEDAGKAVIRGKTNLELIPSIYTEYYKHLYSKLNTFDKAEFDYHILNSSSDFIFSFKTFAQNFTMIDSTKQYSIIVWYKSKKLKKDSRTLIEQLRYNPTKGLLRKLQRFIVNVPENIFKNIKNANYIEDINGYWVQCDENLYKPGLGLLGNESDWIIGSSVI
jgi:CRISPR-associated endonuclease/helicase Cas3